MSTVAPVSFAKTSGKKGLHIFIPIRVGPDSDDVRAFAEILGVLLGVDPWKCGPSLADMDLEGSPEAVKKRVLGL